MAVLTEPLEDVGAMSRTRAGIMDDLAATLIKGEIKRGEGDTRTDQSTRDGGEIAAMGEHRTQ